MKKSSLDAETPAIMIRYDSFVQSYPKTNSGYNFGTFELISNAISILDDVQHDSIIDVYESRDEEDAFMNIEAYKLVEYFWAHEPCYLRYDYDPKSYNGKLHPLNHLDVNISLKGSYKLGLRAKLTPYVFEDIINKNTDCYYLFDKLPSHSAILKNNKRQKKKRERRDRYKKQIHELYL